MENTEIMNNETMVETVEEIATVESGNGLKLVGGALVIAGVIYGGYKLIKKLKSKKNETVVVETTDNYVSEDTECVYEEDL